MDIKITTLQEEILKRLSVAATDGNIDEVTRLSSMAAKTKELSIASGRIQSDLTEIERSLDSHSTPIEAERGDYGNDFGSGRCAPSTIEITIDWSKNGQPHGLERISEKFGSTTMVKLFERLSSVIGSRALETAARMRVNRGPMISKEPLRDYWNQQANKPFGHQQINGTGFAVLTGTDADQKVRDVVSLLRELRLVPGSYSVKKVRR